MGCTGSRSSLPKSKTVMVSQGINLTQITLAFYVIWLKQAIRALKRIQYQKIGFLTNNFSYKFNEGPKNINLKKAPKYFKKRL